MRQSASGPSLTSLGGEPGTSGAVPKLPPVVRIFDEDGNSIQSESDVQKMNLFDENEEIENPANFEYENPAFVAKERNLDSRQSI